MYVFIYNSISSYNCSERPAFANRDVCSHKGTNFNDQFKKLNLA